MRIEGNIQLNRGEWEALFNELLNSDSERARATRNFFEHIDRDIAVSEEGGGAFVRSASLNVDGLRAAMNQGRNRSNSIQRRINSEIIVTSRQGYAKQESINTSYCMDIRARINWENERASQEMVWNAA